MDPDRLVDIYWPVDLLEADAIRQALEAEGIAVHIDGENACSQGGGPMNFLGRSRLRLMVRACDAEFAAQIINDGTWPSYTA